MSVLPKVLKVASDVVFYFFVAVIVAAVVLVVVLALKPGIDTGMTVPISLVPDASAVQVTSDVYGRAELMILTGSATFEEIGSPQHVAGAVAMVAVFLGVALWLLHLVRRIFGAVAAGEPFTDANARRLRLIGALVVVAEFAGALTMFLLQRSVMLGATATGASLASNFTFNPATVLLGLLLIALGEAFRYGVQLQAESELTV